jgi:hypothetical protein
MIGNKYNNNQPLVDVHLRALEGRVEGKKNGRKMDGPGACQKCQSWLAMAEGADGDATGPQKTQE